MNKDCFAYIEKDGKPDCKALNEMVCEGEKCPFYKTKRSSQINPDIHKCKNCKGMGWVPLGTGLRGIERCPVCKGKKVVEGSR